MSFTTKQDIEARKMDERFEQQCAAGLDEIYRAYPTLARCEVTSKLIRSLIAQFLDGTFQPVVLTVPLFEMMLEENPHCGLPVKPVSEQKAQLCEEIMALLRNPDGKTSGGKYSDHDLQRYRKNVLQYMTKEALQERKEGIINAQRLAKLTPEAIRAEERAKRKQDLQQGVLPPEMTAIKLKSNLQMLRMALRSFGSNAVNNRLNGRS